MRKQAELPGEAWRRRWALVNEQEIEELRRMTPDEKLTQLWTLMQAAREMGWDKKLQEEEEQVRTLWIRLRKNGR
jgi:hypothetical protein